MELNDRTGDLESGHKDMIMMIILNCIPPNFASRHVAFVESMGTAVRCPTP